MTFIRTSKFLLGLSVLLVGASIFLLVNPGPKLSIEFTGGTLMGFQATEKTKDEVVTALHSFEETEKQTLGNFTVSSITGPQGESFLLRMRPISNEEHVALLAFLGKSLGSVKELEFTTIGPSLSASLKKNALVALAVASVAIITYLAFAFRKLPRRMNPWKFGVLAVVGFLHDVIITCGFFVIVSHYTSFEFDPLFVTAVLTILAYSANDTIVIFDRIRDNMTYENRHEALSAVIEKGLRQCVTRTINTMLAALITLSALFFLGAESIRWFVLALMFGTVIGAYSSYFIAAPLLLYWK